MHTLAMYALCMLTEQVRASQLQYGRACAAYERP
jgi:hypothetical protein